MIKSGPTPPPGWSPTHRWTKTATDALPKEQGVRAPHQTAQSGCTALERQLLGKQRVLSWRNQRTQRIGDAALKVLNLILSESRHKGNQSGRTWRERVGREVGGGIGMGKTCKLKDVSFQCMTKFTTN